MIADAAELQLNAERGLGEMLVKAKAAGQVTPGQPPKKNGAASEPFSRVRLRDAGVDKKLSASAQKLAAVPERRFAAMVAETREKILAGSAAPQAVRVPGQGRRPSSPRGVSRTEKVAALDLFRARRSRPPAT
jgi:hypothetical protein